MSKLKRGLGKSKNCMFSFSTPKLHCQHQKRIARPGGASCGIVMGDEKMRRPCFPEETGSTSFIKRVNEVKGDSPEGIGAKRKPLTSEGRKPLSSSVARCRFNHSERAFYF